jgi:hypothetical protein
MAVTVQRWGLPAAALVAAACLCMPVSARAEAPVNDTRAGAIALAPTWDNPSVASVSKVVSGRGIDNENWPDAGVTDEDPTPECLGDQGYRSLWYSVDVPESAVLRITVHSDIIERFQPVVSIYGPGGDEVACGLAGPNSRTNPDAEATTYAGKGKYIIRVAQAVRNLPDAQGQPGVTIKVFARDVNPPDITIVAPRRVATPNVAARYTASVADDGAHVNWNTMKWYFCDPKCDQPGTSETENEAGRTAEVRTYKWKNPGLHRVLFEIQDRAGNLATYSWAVYVRDLIRPKVAFSTAVPIPGTRLLRIAIDHDEVVKVKLLITQQRASGQPQQLFKRKLTLYQNGKSGMVTTRRTVLLKPRVGTGSLVISGVARDEAGNATLLPTCVIDPVLATGRCFKP